ncbi:peroxiredoxin family protein [Tumebacillus lipolyticus]|uniref:Peroxiredoxin family protein n=1 Tax=Tumebacillus lipolyticus TaxID=1280370 RepID=A0ABW4ZVJ7_9BACL
MFNLLIWIMVGALLFTTCLLYVWLRQRVKESASAVQNTGGHEALSGGGMQGQPAPDFVLADARQKAYALRDVIKDGVVLVFIDKMCPHCDSHLEMFLESSAHLSSLEKYVILRGDDANLAREIELLYERKVTVLLGEQEIFDAYQIPAYPSFVYVNRMGNIDIITPVTGWVIQVAMMRMQEAVQRSGKVG